MQAYIGNRLIGQLKPKAKQYDVRDNKLTGFLIRVNPSGKMQYVCEYKRGKRMNIAQVGVITPAQARDRAKEILADTIKGMHPIGSISKVNGLTLETFINQHYQPWVEVHRKSGRMTIARIKRCFGSWLGDIPLSEIQTLSIEKWRTKRLATGINRETVNRDIATFKAAISKAVEWSLLDEHPLSKLKLFRVDHNPKVRYLDVEEERQLRVALDHRENRLREERASGNAWRKARGYELYPSYAEQAYVDHLKPMVLLSINTGLRQGELFQLKWCNVDFERALLTLDGHMTKSGRTRHIPLNAEALEVLKSWRESTQGNGLVFQSKTGNAFYSVRKSWLRILKEANIHDFRWHDLRHHFASRLVMDEVDLNIVRELLGHSDLKMTLRYTHLAPAHKANAVAKIVWQDTKNQEVSE